MSGVRVPDSPPEFKEKVEYSFDTRPFCLLVNHSHHTKTIRMEPLILLMVLDSLPTLYLLGISVSSTF